jgi:hypothetical protein
MGLLPVWLYLLALQHFPRKSPNTKASLNDTLAEVGFPAAITKGPNL